MTDTVDKKNNKLKQKFEKTLSEWGWITPPQEELDKIELNPDQFFAEWRAHVQHSPNIPKECPTIMGWLRIKQKQRARKKARRKQKQLLLDQPQSDLPTPNN